MKTLFGLNQTISFTKKAHALSLLVLMAIVFSSCGDGSRQARRVQEEQLKEAKEDAEFSVNQVKRDLEDRIAYLDEEIEKASGELKEELKEARKELKVLESKLDKELQSIKEASLETWNDVLAKASQTIESVGKKRNEISKKVREFFD